MELGTLYRDYAADVFRFTLSLTRNRTEAEDLVSETFLRAWTARDRLAAPTVRAYLFTIARRLHLRSLRAESRRGEAPATIADPSPGADAAWQIDGELAAVVRDLARLPEPERTPLLLRVQNEMPYEEIAAVLDISAAAAKVRVHRARLKLTQWRIEKETPS